MCIYNLYETLKLRLSRSSNGWGQDEDCRLAPASVAMILRDNSSMIELLFIERAQHPEDPWSGNIGFPGGRRDPSDIDLRHTAERETMEEVGIDLSSACFLGRLSDIVGQNLPVRVSCFVYGLSLVVEPTLSEEVQDAFWYPLEWLKQPDREFRSKISFAGRSIDTVAIDLGLPGKPLLWGITYRLVSQFRELVEFGEDLEIPSELPL